MIKYIFSLLAILSFSCQNIEDEPKSIESFLHEDPAIIININNLEKFKSSIKSNLFLSDLIKSNEKISIFYNLIEKLESRDKTIISFNETLDFTIIFKGFLSDTVNTNINEFKDYKILSSLPITGENKVGHNELFYKSNKLDKNNKNFSLIFNNVLTNEILFKLYNLKIGDNVGNLLLNIESNSNTVTFNGVYDNQIITNNENNENNSKEKLKQIEKNFFFNIDKNYMQNSDFSNSNISKEIKLINSNFLSDSNELSNYFKLFQLKSIENITLLNGIVAKRKKKKTDYSFEIKTERPVVLGPILVRNMTNNKNEYLIQDNENYLQLINHLGQVEWSKKINDQIVDVIKQIDIYGDGKYQYLFNTNSELHIIDMQGNNLINFPKKFSDKITRKLSLFDYDNDRNYRILLTQGNKLIMLDKFGNIVKGFQYIAENEIITNPEHFRIFGKDIIVFKTSNELKILNRKGEKRIIPKRSISITKSEIFEHKYMLYTTEKNNKVICIDLEGNVFENKSFNNNFLITSSDDDLYYLERNIISNNLYTNELKFGVYQSLEAYTTKENSLIKVFDSQNGIFYLFDEKLNQLGGFPKKIKSVSEITFDRGFVKYAALVSDKTVRIYKDSI